MSEIRCEHCGKKFYGKNFLTYCSIKKEFVCVQCESLCKNYREEFFPNGTHCYERYRQEEYGYRLLASRILAPEYEVSAAMPKYETESQTGVLFEKFKTQARLYRNIDIDDKQKRADARVELAAMQTVLLKRVMKDPKTRNLYKKINGKGGEQYE